MPNIKVFIYGNILWQNSGDIFAQLDSKDEVPMPMYQQSADAKAKFNQKVHRY
jgi:hypothetical protein